MALQLSQHDASVVRLRDTLAGVSRLVA